MQLCLQLRLAAAEHFSGAGPFCLSKRLLCHPCTESGRGCALALRMLASVITAFGIANSSSSYDCIRVQAGSLHSTTTACCLPNPLASFVRRNNSCTACIAASHPAAAKRDAIVTAATKENAARPTNPKSRPLLQRVRPRARGSIKGAARARSAF